MARFHVYTGDGKGKTTTAMGMAMRALGHGHKVVIVQFLKGQETGEAHFNAFPDNLTFKKFGSDKFVFEKQESDYTMAIDALNYVIEMMKTEPDLFILDEINVALSLDLIPIDMALKIIENCPDKTELVFTGRGAPKEIVERADLVTEMKKLKHYYDKGSPSKKGIEF